MRLSIILSLLSFWCCTPTETRKFTSGNDIVELIKIQLGNGGAGFDELQSFEYNRAKLLSIHPGFIHSQFIKKSNCEFVVITYWNCKEDRDRAIEFLNLKQAKDSDLNNQVIRESAVFEVLHDLGRFEMSAQNLID